MLKHRLMLSRERAYLHGDLPGLLGSLSIGGFRVLHDRMFFFVVVVIAACVIFFTVGEDSSWLAYGLATVCLAYVTVMGAFDGDSTAFLYALPEPVHRCAILARIPALFVPILGCSMLIFV